MSLIFLNDIPRDEAGRQVNTPEWWNGKGERYGKRKDPRCRPDEFRIVAQKAAPPVMEIGPAFGSLSKFIPEDWGYIGVEISDYMVEQARKKYPRRLFINGDFLRLGLEWHRLVRTVIILETLEHLPYTKGAIQKIQN